MPVDIPEPYRWRPYYLRLILLKVAGRSFEELRTVTDLQAVVVERPTRHDAARARGLISGQD